MPLQSLKLNSCVRLTPPAFDYLKGMPLTELDLGFCEGLLCDEGLKGLRGLPLTSLNLETSLNWVGSSWHSPGVCDAGLSALSGMPLAKLCLRGCKQVSDAGIKHLAGLPLTDLNLEHCIRLSDDIVKFLKELPLPRTLTVHVWGCELSKLSRFNRGGRVESFKCGPVQVIDDGANNGGPIL